MGSKQAEIVAAWAEEASGAGWSNTLYWVLVRETEPGPDFGKLRLDSIQPDEQSTTLVALHGPAASMQRVVRNLARAVISQRRQR